MLTSADTYLLFWDVGGHPDYLDSLLKIKADRRICLGNLISEDHDEDEQVRNTVYCLTIAKRYGCHILKGKNEDSCKKFPHPGFVEEFAALKESLEENGLIFMNRLPIRQADEELDKLEERIFKKHGHTDHNMLKNQELEGYYGQNISRNLDFLSHRNPRATLFFAGNRTECALWKPGGAAHPLSIYESLGEKEGIYPLDVTNFPGSLVSPGAVLEGYYCTYNFRTKELILHRVNS